MQKRSNFWKVLLLVVGVSAISVGAVWLLRDRNLKVEATNVGTGVNVNNVAPSFLGGPYEDPASSSAAPTNAGSDVTFKVMADDGNGDDFYLAVCKTDSVTPVNGGAPTCGGGAWCVSGATTDETEANCIYTADGSDAESNVWYAFVCDGDPDSALCSASNQGDGDSGSPFKVNHQPSFGSYPNNSPQDPGASITWTTTGSDPDTDGTADTVKLIVCKTAGISGDACDGGGSDTWCSSNLVASNPSCSYSIPIPTADMQYEGYVYIVDSHNLGAEGMRQGASTSFIVNNVDPVASDVVLNAGTDITLTEGTTTSIPVTATITDNNGTLDINLSGDTVAYVHLSTTGDVCSFDANSCYWTTSWSTSNDTGLSIDVSGSVNIQYHADPTDDNTPNSANNWVLSFIPTDDDGGDDLGTDTVELLSLVGFSVTSSIDYGSLSAGQSNNPLDKITTITATGNVGLDEELSGSDMCTDYPTCSGGVITVDNQRHALAASTAYSSGTVLSGSATEYELNCQKTTVTASPKTKDTWWGVYVPTDTVSGSYTGVNSIVAVKGEYAAW